MLCRSYASPFIYIDTLITNKLFSQGVDELYKADNERKLWELYLSIPVKEKSYTEWKKDTLGGDYEEEQTPQQKKVSKREFETAKEHARNILKKYKPTEEEKGG